MARGRGAQFVADYFKHGPVRTAVLLALPIVATVLWLTTGWPDGSTVVLIASAVVAGYATSFRDYCRESERPADVG